MFNHSCIAVSYRMADPVDTLMGILLFTMIFLDVVIQSNFWEQELAFEKMI